MKKVLALSVLLFILTSAFTYVNTIHVIGKVLNEKGSPIVGASIKLKTGAAFTNTNNKGEFEIDVPEKNSVLVITYVGYETREVTISNANYVTVKLKPASAAMKEVVIAGYGKALADNTARRLAASSAMASMYQQQDVSAGAPGYYEKKDAWRYNNNFNREGYDNITENRFLKTTDNPLSTFSIDVDAASYSNVRRMLASGHLPPAGAVRIEEFINYFSYSYPQPTGNDPFSVNTEIANCPWNSEHRLVSIGLQGRKVSAENLPASNLTFLIDVSGSMAVWNKLPLVKASLKMLTDQLREQDRVSIVVYAGNAGLVLEPTPGSEKMKIKAAIDNLEAGGSTAGGQGVKLAYKTARKNFMSNGNNRVILCTDGDFNVGMTSDDELERLIEEERKSGVFLTVLGYGMGNYQDAKMQKLADKGNGNHAYIDNINEAKKVLVNEFGGTLFTIAKDVKLQVEFNPEKVQGYRLIGYENRMLAKEDFNNDQKDAGELGSGHTVTALYEIVPVGASSDSFDKVDELKYQKTKKTRITGATSGELMTIKLRYKEPSSDVSKLIEHPVLDNNMRIEKASANLRFAAAVAQFGMLLRNSEFKGTGTYAAVSKLASGAVENDVEGYRKEFLTLVEKARKISNKEGDAAFNDNDW